jgi:hypothetical protein
MRLARFAILLVCALAFFLSQGADALPVYTIDGIISDWNVDLSTVRRTYRYRRYRGDTVFVQESFRPNPQGTIQYRVEDYPLSDSEPAGGEVYDYEAIYFDDSPEYLYVGVIASHLYDPGNNTLRITANGVTITKPYFDLFAEANLNINEILGGHVYPNYFWEGAVAKDRFGYLPIGSSVFVYANQNCHNDGISLSGLTNNEIPEPATVLLVGAGLIAVGARMHGKRKRS